MKRISVIIPALHKEKGDTTSRLLEYGILCLIFLLAIAVRLSFYKIQIYDYNTFLLPWYDYIKAHNGFAALKDNFSDYNPPYLYLLALTTYIPVQPLVAIKSISIVFDMIMAFFTFLLLRLRYQHSSIPPLGAVVVLFAPTVILNSSAWGQCDAIYTTWCLASLYFLLSKRPVWACICFGLAFAFKLQALFFFPVLLVLLLRRKLAIRWLILIPIVYLTLLIPARFEDRDIWSLLTIYLHQAHEASGALTMNAPNFYQWIPTSDVQDWTQLGVILASTMVALICFLTVASRKSITADIILKLTLVFALAIPFFLPGMHDRYFYLADIVSIIYAFYFPYYWYIALVEQLCSFFSYAPTFSNLQGVSLYPLTYEAFGVLFLMVVTLADLVKTLFPTKETFDCVET
jgi:Gpi18-like mannosyltransferase